MANVTQTIRLLALIFAGVMITPMTRDQNAAASSQDAQPISGTRSASCLLRIITEPSVLSLSYEVSNYLFQSSGVYDRAAQEVLGLIPASSVATIQFLEQAEAGAPRNEQRTLLRLEVQLPEDVKPAARELMGDLIANFQQALEEAYRSEMGRLDSQIQLADQEVQRAEVELTETQKSLLAISQQDLSSQDLRSRITALTSQLQGFQLEKAAKEAYRQAIQERIAKVRDEMEKSLQEDAVATELQRIVERRMTELARVQELIKTNVAASSELDAVEDKLATARIELARRRDELGRSGAAGNLGQLTSELATLTLDAVQARVREEQLHRQLKEAQELLPRAAEYERMMLRSDVAKRNMQEAIIQHSRAQQRARMLQMPSVSVIGG